MENTSFSEEQESISLDPLDQELRQFFLDLEQDRDDIIIKCDLEKIAKAFFKDYEIIWHDPNVNSQENQQYLTQLQKLCQVKTFTNSKEAEDYIKAAKTICHVITSGTNGELLVKEIFSSQNVPKIFTFCRAKEYHSNWTQNYEKILCTETKIEDVISQIQNNLQEWQKQTSSFKFDLPAFAPIFNDWDKSQMNHLHLYLKVLPQFKNWEQAKEDLMSLSKRVYSDKKQEKFITDFEHNYNEYNKEAILKWYTQQSFLFKIINNCLRIATSDSIQWSRLLLKDIEMAIQDQYQAKSKNFSGVLYRSAYLSQKEWLSLKDNVNREIEMHGFLSASKEEKFTLSFMGVDPAQKVFITILVPKSPFEDEQGFAEIEEFSKFPKEKEVLFNVRSRFTVLEAEDEYSKDSPYRHLVLLYGAYGLRRFITERNPTQQVPIEHVENISCSRCKVPAGEIKEKFIFLSLLDIEKQIYSCKKCLDDDTTAPFLCISLTEKPSTVEIKGCLLMSSSQTQIPFYGYKCSKCGVKNEKRYFVCTDCQMKWCENCFNNPLSCINSRHSIILETSPFSFWSEKMSENELNHLKFHKAQMTSQDINIFREAEMFSETHEYEKAIEYYNISIVQNEAKGNTDKLARSYNDLGSVYQKLGESKKALESLLKSLEIKISVHGENHPSVATAYSNIGSVYDDQGDSKKALEYLFKSLEIDIQVHGENHPSVANSYNNIGSIYENQGEYKKGLEYLLKSLEINISIHGKNHPEVATSYINIGSIYKNQGEYKKALEYLFKSLEIDIPVHGENHPSVAISYNSIGSIYEIQGEYKKGLEYLLKSLKIDIQVHGENHPSVANSYNNIGSIYKNQGEEKKALEYLLKSLQIYVSVHGENHPSVAISYNNLGSIYGNQGEYKKALEYLLKSLEIEIPVHGENHPSVATAYYNIGSVYQNQGESNMALEYYSKSLNIRKSVCGENHPFVATSYNDIGVVYNKQREYKKALEYYSKSLNIRKSVYGENHPSVAASYDNIGAIYETQGEYEKALEYYLKSLDIYKSVYGEDHPETATLHDKIRKVTSIAQNATQESWYQDLQRFFRKGISIWIFSILILIILLSIY